MDPLSGRIKQMTDLSEEEKAKFIPLTEQENEVLQGLPEADRPAALERLRQGGETSAVQLQDLENQLMGLQAKAAMLKLVQAKRKTTMPFQALNTAARRKARQKIQKASRKANRK